MLFVQRAAKNRWPKFFGRQKSCGIKTAGFLQADLQGSNAASVLTVLKFFGCALPPGARSVSSAWLWQQGHSSESI